MSPAADILAMRQQFDEFDAFAVAARNWEVDFQQLDQGRFVGEMEQVSAGAVTVLRCQFNRKLQQLGNAPPGCRTFAVPMPGHTPHMWRRHEVTSEDLTAFGANAELNCTSMPGFHVFAVSIGEELMAEAAQRLGYDSHESIINREQVAHCDPERLEALRRVCQASAGFSSESLTSEQAVSEELQWDLPSLMLQGFLSADRKHPVPISRERQKALRLAMEAIEDSEESIWKVSELCQLTGIRERTLRYAFVEALGVSPKAYLQSRRLNDVHRALLQGGAQTTIADVANGNGFWHMGQFAADYRQMFGELPSTTLLRVS